MSLRIAMRTFSLLASGPRRRPVVTANLWRCLAHRAGAIADRGLEALAVLAELRLTAKRGPQVIQQGAVGRFDLVEHPESTARIAYQPRPLEVVQMPRDVGLRQSQHVLDVAPAQLPIGKQVHQSQSRRIGESTEALGNVHGSILRLFDSLCA